MRSSHPSAASVRPIPSRHDRRRRTQAAIRAALEPVEPRRLMASVSGTVFGDYNSNGTRDAGEQPTGYGVGVFADLNGSGAFDAGEPNGFAMSSLPGTPTAFTIRNVPATGRPFQLLVNHVGSSFVATRAQTVTVTSEGQAITARDVGLATDPATVNIFGRVTTFRVTTGAAFDVRPITGRRVYEDLDNDRILDAGEPSTLPLADGTYRLNALPNTLGQIRIESTPTSAPELQGSLGILRDNPGVVVDERNLGERTGPGELVLRPYRDSNLNGAIDAGDAPATLASAWIDLNGNKRLDAGETQLAAKPVAAGGFRDYAAVVTLGQYPVAYRLAGDTDLIADGVTTGKALSEPGPTINATNVDNPTNGAAVYGNVFDDVDGDGVRDAGEAGLAGRTVYADLNYNGVKDAAEPSGTTIASGNYGIVGIAPQAGSVAIRLLGVPASEVTAPAGGIHSGRFNAGINYVNRNFGVAPAATGTATLVGYVFLDADRDGVRDAGEGAQPGAVFIDANNNFERDPEERIVYIDSSGDGRFEFTGVPAGTPVTVRAINGQTSRPGTVFSNPDSPFAPGFTVTSAAGTTVNVGNFAATGRAGGIFVTTYTDVDGNGRDDVYDADRPVADIWLDLDRDGAHDASEPTIPDSFNGGHPPSYLRNSSYLDVPPGTFRVAVRNLDGTVESREVTVAEGGTRSVAFAKLTTRSVVSGVVFTDADRDSVRDPSEAGLSLAGVFADYNDNGVQDGLEPRAVAESDGTYFLEVDNNRTFTLRARTYYEGGEPIARTYSVRFDATGTRSNLDFGYSVAPAPTATVTGTVFNDADQDGVRDAGEAGLSGRTVYADLNYNGVKDASEPSAVTDAGGLYSIGGIAPQAASVAIRLLGVPSGQITTPGSGFHSGKITAAATYANRNFGIRPA